MNSKEQLKYVRQFKQFARDILASKTKARQFLIDAGIHTKSGRLTKRYK